MSFDACREVRAVKYIAMPFVVQIDRTILRANTDVRDSRRFGSLIENDERKFIFNRSRGWSRWGAITLRGRSHAHD
ncbi:hypothetical protein AOT96_00075 [Rhodococcus sp. 008]|nr:hypothetical protein AOT96_00075 [Rhodococcus sp. 008]